MTRRAKITGAVAAAALALAAYGVLQEHLRKKLTVVNRSGTAVNRLDIGLPWQTLHFDAIENGGQRSVAFEIRHDAHFSIDGELADGTAIRAAEGYVTNGQYNDRVQIEIGRGATINFRQGIAAE